MDENKTTEESELDPNTGIGVSSTSFNKSNRMYSGSASTSWNSDKFIHEIECLELAPEEVDKIRQYAQALKEKNITNESCPFRWINRQERKRLLPESVRKLSLSRAIQYKIAEIPTVEEIQDFTLALETSSKVVIVDETQKMIGFDDFLEILRKSPKRLLDIMEPGTLWGVSQESQDENGRMHTEIIVQYISLKCSLWRYRTMLARYDEDCIGCLSKKHLKEFMLDEVIPVTDHLKELKNEALDAYLLTVQSMFFFFMDQKNFGYCRIADILVSGFLENIFGMQCATDDPETYERVICENWFSYDKTAELRSLFKMLDDDEKGYLTKSDFSKVNDNAYTPACVDRFFEVHVANRGEKMSYEEFVIFMIAQNHLAHPASLAYFFKILDIHDKGYLTQFDLKYFYRSMKVAYEDYISIDSMPPFEDYCDELYDMTQSRNSKRIYLKDILNCKQGHDVVLCLLNCYEFYRYETLMYVRVAVHH
ncbi:EF-hand domain pair domain-containing protein [Ditylenchus destructor]|uniref:EF-hand domain pair domain-containing protein n=1 Tax=Ditylenchus destructor TaxID=166010 RepID=A0AAD4MWJ1_9BILA|nr:EF-hand domain pair domain-containing protein [Ditylenchus destructor]